MTLPVRDDVPLAPLTTLELGGNARHLVEAADDDTVVEALRWAEARGLPALILGGGSNVVIADRGWDGLVVRVATRGRRFAESSDGTVTLTAAAGEPWDDVVADTVARDLAGLECLSGIPGLVGATPIQNVGAYGQEVADTIRSVTVVERASKRVHRAGAGRVRLRLPRQRVQARSRPVRGPGRHVRAATGRRADAPLPGARRGTGGGKGGAPPTLADVRAAVLALRRKKSMLIVDGDPNRRSVGSFFTNPIVGAAEADAVAARAVALGAIARARRDAALAGGRRGGQAVGRLADRARRHSQGAAPGRGGRFDRARARARPPGRRVDRRRCSSWRARCATRCMAGSL